MIIEKLRFELLSQSLVPRFQLIIYWFSNNIFWIMFILSGNLSSAKTLEIWMNPTRETLHLQYTTIDLYLCINIVWSWQCMIYTSHCGSQKPLWTEWWTPVLVIKYSTVVFVSLKYCSLYYILEISWLGLYYCNDKSNYTQRHSCENSHIILFVC